MEAKFWSPAEIDTLTKLSSTQSATTIGKQIGRTKDAVKNKILQLGLQSYQQRRNHGLPTAAPIREIERVTTFNYAGQPARYSVRQPMPGAVIEWCPMCHSPVSDWIGHFERSGHKRPK